MSTLALSAINQLVLSLYRDGRDLQLHQFQDWALEQVCCVIPFDSACWGNAALEPVKIHWVHRYHCDDSSSEAYSPYIPHDFFRAQLLAQPGVSVNLSERIARTELYMKVGKAYQVEWSLGTLLVEPMSALSEYLTLWRHDPQRPFTEFERAAKELLMPHLVETYRGVLLRHFLKERQTQRKAWALVDQQGFIREAAPAFSACLRAHWPHWHGNRLPDELAQCVIEGRAFETKALDIALSQSENLRFLEVKERSLLDKLTARESEIVTRFANGETYSAIAAALSLAPATVRNHLSRCYRKLGVNSKAELAKLVASKRRAR
jgi:DNA-binding CsgD family transcriptional regulator